MAETGTMRMRRLWADPVFRALLISMLLHLSVFGGWKIGQKYELWRYVPAFAMLKLLEERLMAQRPPPAMPPQEREIQLSFLEVDPTRPPVEAPPDAKFYGAVSTEAANPTPAETAVPKIEGKQTEKLKVIEDARPKAEPLRPTPVQAKADDAEIEAEAKPKKEYNPGDLAIAKPVEQKQENTGTAETKKGEAEKTTRPRPRTLAEARKAAVGPKTEQDGGVKKYDLSASMAVKGSIVGNYDQRFIQAVRQRWDTLLEQVSSTKPGKVILEFRIHQDGRISEMKVVESNVTEFQSVLCQKAILDPAPYDKWPMEMRRELKGDTRDVTFTFYYLAQ